MADIGATIGSAFIKLRPDTKDFASETNHSIGGALKGVGAVTAGALAGATAAVAGFAAISVNKFKDVGAEVLQLTRVTGLTAEAASQLRFAGQQSGVGVDQLSQSLVILSRNLANNKDALAKTGIAFSDAKGKTLPLDQALGNIAERFKTLPNGVEKNALALQLFGRSGATLIPFLNRGKDGLEGLRKEADKLGITLTQGNLDALKKNVQAHKDLSAAMDGVKIQLGAALLPVLADGATAFAKVLTPAIAATTAVIQDKLGPAFQRVWPAAQKAIAVLVNYIRSDAMPWLVDKWRAALPTFEGIWDKVKTAFVTAKDIVKNTLIPALGDLFSWLSDKVGPAASALAKTFSENLLPVIGGAGTAAGIAVVAGTVSDLAGAIETLRLDALLSKPAAIAAVAVGALALTSGNFRDAIKDIARDLAPIGDAIQRAFGGKITVPKAPDFAASDQDLGIGNPGKTIAEAFKAVDWSAIANDLGKALAAGLKGAVSAAADITAGIIALVDKVNWGAIAIAMGKRAPEVLVGLAAGLLSPATIGNLFRFVVDNWFLVLSGAFLVAFAPARLIGVFAKVPFVGSFLEWFLVTGQRLFRPIFDFAFSLIGKFVEGFISNFPRLALAVDVVPQIVGRLPGLIAARVAGLFGQGAGMVDSLAVGIGSRLGALAIRVGEIIATVARAIAGWNPGAALFNAGVHIVDGLISGIASRIASLIATMATVAKAVTDHLPHSPAKKGPLSGKGDTRLAGQTIVGRLAEGIASSLPELTRQANAAAATFADLGAGSVAPLRLAGAGAGVSTGAVTTNKTYQLNVTAYETDHLDVVEQFRRMERLSNF